VVKRLVETKILLFVFVKKRFLDKPITTSSFFGLASESFLSFLNIKVVEKSIVHLQFTL